MSTITYSDFSTGLDRRKSFSTAPASSLRELKNAYITTGKTIRKRPGTPLVTTLEAGTKGLVSGNGVLNTFYPYNATPITHAHADFTANALTHALANTAYGGGTLSKIHAGFIFLGYLYIAAEYSDGNVFHYWLDGTNPDDITTRGTGTSCPNTRSILKAKSRIFAINSETVDYCALNNPADWDGTTGSASSGNLAFGANAEGSANPSALGLYDGKLVAFSVDSGQLYELNEDKTLITFWKSINGLGCGSPKTPKIFAGDMMFLAKRGFRSIRSASYAENLQDVDVGSPIDRLLVNELSDSDDPISAYFSNHNQFWCGYPRIGSSRVWVYTFSRSEKIKAWAKYELGFEISDIEGHNGSIYIRSGDNVYKVDETDSVFADAGVAYEMQAEFPFLDFKTPGVDKTVHSMDLVVTGSVDVRFRYDPNDETRLTDAITLTGDSRQKATIPVEITSTGLAPVFTSNTTSAVEIHSFQFHYDNLGVQ